MFIYNLKASSLKYTHHFQSHKRCWRLKPWKKKLIGLISISFFFFSLELIFWNFLFYLQWILNHQHFHAALILKLNPICFWCIRKIADSWNLHSVGFGRWENALVSHVQNLVHKFSDKTWKSLLEVSLHFLIPFHSSCFITLTHTHKCA